MKRLAERLLLLFAAFACLAAAAPLLLADSNVRIVRLSYVDGEVQIDQRDGQGFQTAFMNMPVTPGTRIETKADSRAEIELEDGSTIRLAPDTLIEFTSMSLRSDGSRDTMASLEGGTAYIDLRHQRDDDFRLDFAHNTVTLRHSVRFRVTLDDAHVTIVPMKSDLEVLTENGRSIDIRKGETLTLDLTDPEHFYRAATAEPGPVDAWDQERADYRESFAANSNRAGYASYQNSVYDYGTSDMNYYGAYTVVPGYGWVWQPNYMPIGWNPYMDGAWVFYPGYGWQWVSAYPWGWMPYHYGSWSWINGRGWCWRRDRDRDRDRRERWHPAPVVTNPPPHFQPPVPPPTSPPNPRPGPGQIPPRPMPRVVIIGNGGSTIYPPGEATRVRGRIIPDGDRQDRDTTTVAPPRMIGPPVVQDTPAPPRMIGPPVVQDTPKPPRMIGPPVVQDTPPPNTVPPTKIDRGTRYTPPPQPVTPPTTQIQPVTPPPRMIGPPVVQDNTPPPVKIDRGTRYTPPPSPPPQTQIRPYTPPPSPPPQTQIRPYTPPSSPPPPRPVTPPSTGGGTSSRPSPPPPPPPHNDKGTAQHDHPR
jgi:uncharacterized protein DUF6600/FecR-like protein